MANKPRLGLDYYTTPVNYCRLPKIRLLKKRYGSAGFHAYEFLRGIIFEAGSYLKFDNEEEIINEIEDEIRVSNKEAEEILHGLLEINLFDQNAYENGYLTSHDIQEHYYFATKERKIRIQPDCWLLSEAEMNDIDSGIKYKNVIMGRENAILPGENDIVGRNNRQSKSNRKTKKESNTYSDDNDYKDRMKRINNIKFPFKPSYYFMMLIADEIITGYETFSEALNNHLLSLEEAYNKDYLFKAVKDVVHSIKSNKYHDAEGRKIDDFYNYLCESIEHNAACNKHIDEYPPFEGLDELLKQREEGNDVIVSDDDLPF